MRLLKLRVENFKSIDDSTEFDVDQVTCLVGKNESGKTALLQALHKLNPIIDGAGAFQPLEFPRRRWSEYKEQQETKPANVLTTTWQIEQADRDAVATLLGPAAFTQSTVKVEKGYRQGAAGRTWNAEVDEAAAVAHLLATSGLHAEEIDTLGSHATLSTLIAGLQANTSPSARETAFLARLNKTFPKADVGQAVRDLLAARLPKFIYFGEYDKLPGQVSLTDLLTRKAADPSSLTMADRLFLALLDLAGTSAEQLDKSQQFEPLIAELEAVQNRITQEIFKYWSQNQHLKVNFKFDAGRPQDPPPFNTGWIFRTRIENTRHGASVSFDERSTGFVWFFSFLVWFSQLRKVYGNNLFVLLDEPGLTLHARAQRDLLRYFNDKLRPSFQLMYTTHSPFMIDPENLLAVRTVEDALTKDGEPLGSKVGDKVFSSDPDTVFPLQAALGYEITQTLFVGANTLLVEGPSDLLYLKWAARQLKLRNRATLDGRWTISPAGGIDKIGSFVTLFSGKNLHIAVLSDFHAGDKQKVRTLRESTVLKAGHVLTAESYAGQPEADIEDLLGRELYMDLVNRTYNLTGAQALSGTAAGGVTSRVVAEVQQHFGTLPPTAPQFDHFEPAAHLTEQFTDVASADALKGLGTALDRFEKVFADLNALLPSAKL